MNREKAINTVKLYWPIDEGGPVLREAIETLIPELKESEDERIKNFLIGKFREIGEVWHEYSTKDIIAWLEKQGEQKSAWSEEDEIRFESTLHRMEIVGNGCAFGQLKDDIEWLKSLKERYTWKPTEKQLQVLDSVYKTHGLSAENKHIFLELLNELKNL